MSIYWVTAELSEPKYGDEWKFLAAELDVVERMIHRKRPRYLRNFSLPAVGIYAAKDWRHYEHELHKYADKLDKYTKGVNEGVMPVKFSVFNNADTQDKDLRIHLKVAHGRVDELRKAPERPARMDAAAKPWKLKLPAFVGFSRSKIKITAHGVGVNFSGLGPHDGAALIQQILHLHCTSDTQITYEISSRNVEHETGFVEFAD
ncbi:MAG: hypothetical protein NVSMB39_0930 [Candidatus Saccharimonadales bacterium]